MVRSSSALARLRRHRARPLTRGFTLIELMVVVVIIGIFAALAVPSMRIATYDRHAFEDAGSIMQILRSARARSVARGAAVLVEMSASGQVNRGTFTMYEAVSANPNGGGIAATPVSSCKSPTVWTPLSATNAAVRLVDALNLNGAPEIDGDIQTTLMYYNNSGAAPTTFTDGFICFTPLGHSYANIPAGSPPSFIVPNAYPIEALVKRAGGKAMRSVLLPPNGVARVFSHIL